jgi:carboxymethylenebutenolidase
MCDEFTARAEDAALDRGISRRYFATIGAGAALVACAGAGAGEAKAPRLRERMVRITTPDGTADAFLVHPSKGRHPAVILWPDVGGLRDAMKRMGRRLAGSGYAVLVVNQYYRTAPAPLLASFSEWRTPEGQARLRPAIARLTSEGTARDGMAFVAFLDAQRAVDRGRKIGTQGYCMGGAHALRTAGAVPARVGAAASFHGGGLASDKPDSPHLLLPRSQASYLIAVARNDDARDAGEKDRFRVAAEAAGRPAEIEVYPADHGWCVPDTPIYDQTQADRAWERLLALYAKL